MGLEALTNLQRIGQLKAEPRNDAEVRRLLAMAKVRLADAQLQHCGVCLMPRTRSATWPSTRAISKSRKALLRSCAAWSRT